MAELEDEMLGKRILFTDRDDWSIAEVVASLPVERRGRLPSDERSQGRLVLADVPLDRSEDPRPGHALPRRGQVDRAASGSRLRSRQVGQSLVLRPGPAT